MMETIALIIKHPCRDWDWRVDIYEIPEDCDPSMLRQKVESEMLGMFQVMGLSDRVSYKKTPTDLTPSNKPIKITDPRQIYDLANKGKSIFHTGWGRQSPAVFFVGWPLRSVMIAIDCGVLEIYQGKDHPGRKQQHRITKKEKQQYEQLNGRPYGKRNGNIYGQAILPTKAT